MGAGPANSIQGPQPTNGSQNGRLMGVKELCSVNEFILSTQPLSTAMARKVGSSQIRLDDMD